MKKEQRYYFRAEEGKVEEILKILEELGGKRYYNYCAKSEHCIYYISPSGWIERADINSEEHELVTCFYEEAFLIKTDNED